MRKKTHRFAEAKMRYTETDDSAVSPVIGVILMVAITVILAAVIGTFVLGLGDQVQETPTAGISVSQDPGTVQATLIDTGNLEGLFLQSPSGVKSTEFGEPLLVDGAGVTVTLRSNGTVSTFISNNNITIPGPGGAPLDVNKSSDIPAALASTSGGLQNPEAQNEIDELGYNDTNAYIACLVNQPGFTVGGQRIGSNITLPCHTPVLGQSDAVDTGTSVEAGGSTLTSPILLGSGDYRFLGEVGGENSVVQSFTVSDDVSGQ